MVTPDNPPAMSAAEWAAHMARPSPGPITLDPYTVELLCGGRCRECGRLRAENDALTARLAEYQSRAAVADPSFRPPVEK